MVDLITNEVLYDNLSALTYEEYEIRGIGIWLNADFKFNYRDTEANCRNGAEFYLQKTTVSNQIKYCYFYYTGIAVLDCLSYAEQEDIPMFLPWDDLILTKQ